jgi:histidyl-tRNA synthetase
MNEKIQAIRGMKDLMPNESSNWLALENIISDLFISYGFKKINTPIVEKTDTFCRAIGEQTDIVSKEMYSWQTNNKSLSLRPEGTAGCVRAMIEHNLLREGIQKVFYQGAMFRHERPQKGRYRQFHQMGVEVFNIENAKIDAELIIMTQALWKKLGLKNIHLEINTLGSSQTRLKYKTILTDYFEKNKNKLDEDSLKRLKTNPLRILDSKNKDMQELISNTPKLIDYLDDESKQHFSSLKEFLNHLNIEYKINPNLVRGLDYYNKTVFEWCADNLGSQNAICAGGRYDNLVEKMGGKSTFAVGFAIGLERLILLLKEQNIDVYKKPLSIYFISFGNNSQLISVKICEQFRLALKNIILYNDSTTSNFKSQLKKADKMDFDYALIMGEEEINNNNIIIKPLKKQNKQQTLNLEKAINYFINL